MSFLDWEEIKKIDSTGISERITKKELGVLKIQAQKEAEFRTLLYFLRECERITDKKFNEIESFERPDFLCTDKNNQLIGVELTQVRRSPSQSDYETIIKKTDHMDPIDALEMLQHEIYKKESKIKEPDWKTTDASILVVEFNDIPLTDIQNYLTAEDNPDLNTTAFSEIWIVDLTDLDAYQDVELFCLVPSCYEGYYPRPSQKPYG